MMTDPIGDLLTRIRNAGMARHAITHCPYSRQKFAVAQVLGKAGFVGEVGEQAEGGFRTLSVGIRYDDSGRALIDGIRRISKPGCRVYVGKDEIPKVRNGLGIAVLSTSRGIMSDVQARELSVGGEVICEVW
jgi:small subunit ribosomal protein S8